MNRQTFYDHFEYLADAPNGVTKLREMILQLAVQGKLVPQDPNDEPASVLLEKIKAEKEKRIKQGKIKKPKPLPPVTPEEFPYELPEGWEWVRLGDYTHFIMGQSPASKYYNQNKIGLPFYQGKAAFGKLFPKPVKWCEAPQKVAEKNDILISVRAPVGPTNICQEKSCIGRGLAAIRSLGNVNHMFLLYQLRAIEPHIASLGVGSTFVAISRTTLDNILFAVPPSAEQHRIVTKVDQLMDLCDQLETRQQKKETARARLNQSITDNLLTAPTPKAFTTGWQRLCHNFDLLYDTPETIPTLRQTILQLAVQGKLAPQNPNDEPASVLLEKIKTEKEKLIKQGKIKKSKPLPPVTPEEVPYELPEGWEWVSLGFLGEFCGGGTPAKNKPNYWGGNIHWVSPKDMKNTHISDSELFITENAIKETRIRLIPKNSLLIVARSGILKRTLPVAINKVECTVNQDLKVIIPFDQNISEFLRLMLKGHESSILKHLVKGGMTVQSLKYTEFETQPFPFPPLPEQHRIVAKVDQLMALCDELEEKLTKSTDSSQRLTEAVIHHLTAA